MSTFADKGSFRPDKDSSKRGSYLIGSMVVELITADQRTVRTKQFIEVWNKNVNKASGLDKLNIRAPGVALQEEI